MNKTVVNASLLIFIILTWGYSWVLMKIGLQFFGPFTFAAWRCGVGGLVMLPFLIHNKITLPKRDKLLDYLIIGLFQTTLMFGLMLYGMRFVTAGKTAVLLYTMPIWTSLILQFVLKEKLNSLKWIGVLLGSLGILSILGWDTLVNQDLKIFMGEVLIISGAISWAISNILIKKRMDREDPYIVNAFQLLIGTIGLILLAIPFERTLDGIWTIKSIFIILFTGVVASSVNFTIWFYLLKKLDINTATFSSMLVPVVGILFDWMILGSRLDPGIVLGGVLILMGIFLVSKKTIHSN